MRNTKLTSVFCYSIALIFLLMFCFVPQEAKSQGETEIAWLTTNSARFTNSVYQALLRRNATAQEIADWQAQGPLSKKKRAELFWKLVGSPEYRARFGHLKKEYFVYWDTKRYLPQNRDAPDKGVGLCHCYLFSKSEYVFSPSPQYLGIHSPSGPFHFGVASAVRDMYALFDRNTCTLFECGYKGEKDYDEYTGSTYEECLIQYCPGCSESITLLGVSTDADCNKCIEKYKVEIDACRSRESGNTVGNNLVKDPNFASFGGAQTSWSNGYQFWSQSGNNQSTAQRVELPSDTRLTADIRTALMIQNYSGRGPHVYGTTMQPIQVTKGITYQIKLWAAAENLASTSGVVISVDAQWKVRPIRLTKGTYDWTEFQGTFTATSDEALIRIIAQDKGQTYITGFSLREHQSSATGNDGRQTEQTSKWLGTWAYANGSGIAEFKQKGNSIIGYLTYKPRQAPSPHYLLRLESVEGMLKGTWEFTVDKLIGNDKRYEPSHCRSGKFVAQINDVENRIMVLNSTEDPCGHSWNGLVFYRP